MSVLVFDKCTMVCTVVTKDRNWIKDIRELSVVSLRIFHKINIIAKQFIFKVIQENYSKMCGNLNICIKRPYHLPRKISPD